MRVLLSLLFCLPAVGDDTERTVPSEGTGNRIAARVDGEAITAAEVVRELDLALGERPVAVENRPRLEAQMLEQLVSRKLILRWLAETQQAASDADIDLAIRELEQRLTQRGATLDDFLQQQKLDQDALRRGLRWQISWQRYLDKQLTDANLEKYFDKHRRQFDGTELRVAHILWKVDPAVSGSLQEAEARAQDVLRQLRDGAISFEDAAKKHSASPSRENGGDIGFIARRQPMPESFSRAAFDLNAKEISDPIVTSFGVHLIQCLEVKPGQKTWMEVRAELEQAVTKYLFDWAGQQMRSRLKIEYTEFPHFHPATGQLVE